MLIPELMLQIMLDIHMVVVEVKRAVVLSVSGVLKGVFCLIITTFQYRALYTFLTPLYNPVIGILLLQFELHLCNISSDTRSYEISLALLNIII